MRLKEDNDSRYINNGYKDRGDYLKNLADDYGIDLTIVNELAGMMGPNEDFDGLVTELEDSYNAGLLDDFRIEYTQNIDYEKLFETWADFDDVEAADEVNQLIEVKELGEIDALSFIAFCYGYKKAMETIRNKT